MSTGIMQHRVFFPTIRRYPKTNVSGQLAWIKDPKLLSQKKKERAKAQLGTQLHACICQASRAQNYAVWVIWVDVSCAGNSARKMLLDMTSCPAHLARPHLCPGERWRTSALITCMHVWPCTSSTWYWSTISSSDMSRTNTNLSMRPGTRTCIYTRTASSSSVNEALAGVHALVIGRGVCVSPRSTE
jgi:hypothetical protein